MGRPLPMGEYRPIQGGIGIFEGDEGDFSGRPNESDREHRERLRARMAGTAV